MAYFGDAQEVYDFIGRLFVEVVADAELGPKFQRADTIVRYRFSDPDAQVTVKIRAAEETRVDLGDSDLEPEVEMTMAADTAHRFWLGKVNVTVALARGQIKAKGPVAKVLKLVPLAKPAFPRYRAMIEDAGREDLLEAA